MTFGSLIQSTSWAINGNFLFRFLYHKLLTTLSRWFEQTYYAFHTLDKSCQHQEWLNSWECRKSNVGPLGVESPKLYLCYSAPLLFSFLLKWAILLFLRDRFDSNRKIDLFHLWPKKSESFGQTHSMKWPIILMSIELTLSPSLSLSLSHTHCSLLFPSHTNSIYNTRSFFHTQTLPITTPILLHLTHTKSTLFDQFSLFLSTLFNSLYVFLSLSLTRKHTFYYTHIHFFSHSIASIVTYRYVSF